MNTNGLKKITKRKRQSRPNTLIFSGLIFIFLPVASYFYLAYEIQVSFHSPLILFSRLNLVEIILLFLPLAVGVGLFSTKKWGWWLFLIYGISLILYNLYVLKISPDLLNISAALQSIFGVATVYYFTQKDISAPYMKMVSTRLEDAKAKPNWNKYYSWWTKIANAWCKLIIPTSEGDLQLEAGVVRVDEDGAGIAFRNVDRKVSKVIKNLCANYEKKNQIVQTAWFRANRISNPTSHFLIKS